MEKFEINPHEREARDLPPSHQFLSADNFNPHEREARDCNKCLACGKSWILIHTSVKLVTQGAEPLRWFRAILIHTSVKLVTLSGFRRGWKAVDFNPHEREARDDSGAPLRRDQQILIHTSVKLVTNFTFMERISCRILIHTSVKLVTLPDLLTCRDLRF